MKVPTTESSASDWSQLWLEILLLLLQCFLPISLLSMSSFPSIQQFIRATKHHSGGCNSSGEASIRLAVPGRDQCLNHAKSLRLSITEISELYKDCWCTVVTEKLASGTKPLMRFCLTLTAILPHFAMPILSPLKAFASINIISLVDLTSTPQCVQAAGSDS